MRNADSPLTGWQERQWAALLAAETPEWWDKRYLAQDSNTTADVLERFIDDIYNAYGDNDRVAKVQICLLAEEVAAHPNIPPNRLRLLLNLPAPFAYFCPRGFCRNPIAAHLFTETPDFWETLVRLERTSGEAVVREASLPAVVAAELTKSKEPDVSDAARLHRSLAGEIATKAEGIAAITSFWKEFCRTQSRLTSGESERSVGQVWHAEMVEIALAPPWALGETMPISPRLPPSSGAYREWRQGIGRRSIRERLLLASSPKTSSEVLVSLAKESGDAVSPYVRRLVCRHLNAPLDIVTHARHGFVATAAKLLTRFYYFQDATLNDKHLFNRTDFVKFVANLHRSLNLSTLYDMGQSAVTMERLSATLAMPLGTSPFPDDPWNRSPLLLLQHLSHDGNRLVRWAAQTRLADPAFAFTWDDSDN